MVIIHGLDTNYDVLHSTKYKLVWFEINLKNDKYGPVKHENIRTMIIEKNV